MSNPDIEISDVDIIVDQKFDGRISEIVEKLKSLGMKIEDIDESNGVIQGSIDSSKLAQLRALDGVDHLRDVMTYIEHDPENPTTKGKPLEP